MPAPAAILTIGYEGADQHAFLTCLQAAEVDLVVDVRELPLSRKRGFSKRPLAEALSEAGIDYLHLPRLGTPKPIRDAYKASGDWAPFSAAYRQHLVGAEELMAEVAQQARERGTALLCFEADPLRCHRSVLADELRQRGLVAEVRHLSPLDLPPAAPPTAPVPPR